MKKASGAPAKEKASPEMSAATGKMTTVTAKAMKSSSAPVFQDLPVRRTKAAASPESRSAQKEAGAPAQERSPRPERPVTAKTTTVTAIYHRTKPTTIAMDTYLVRAIAMI